jgi:hypothetical protein
MVSGHGAFVILDEIARRERCTMSRAISWPRPNVGHSI